MFSLCCIYIDIRQWCYRGEFTWMHPFLITLFSSFLSSWKIIVKIKSLRQRLQRASEGLSIPKSLRSTFLSGAELLLFVLRIASEQYGREAYPQQKSFRNNIYLQSVNGPKNIFQNCGNKNVEKIHKWIYYFL